MGLLMLLMIAVAIAVVLRLARILGRPTARTRRGEGPADEGLSEEAAISEAEHTAPTRSGVRSQRAAVVAAVWLASLGVAAAVIGVHDAVAGTEITVRLVGSLLLAAGVVLIAGAGGLKRRTPDGLALAMIAGLLGIAMGVMTFVAQAVNDEPDRRLLAWGAIIVASAAVALYVRAQTPAADRPKSIWSRLPILKSAVSIGFVISTAQFWYSQIYLPTTAPPSLTLEAKITKVTPRGKHLVVEGFVVIRNTSRTKVQVLASSLDVSGIRIVSYAAGSDEFRASVKDADLEKFPSADRYGEKQQGTIVSHGRLVPESTFFEPGETVTVPVLTWVRKGKYNAVKVSTLSTVGRGETLGIQYAIPEPCVTDTGVVYRTRLPEAGWMRRLTRGSRYLRVTYGDDARTSPLVRFAPGQESGPKRSSAGSPPPNCTKTWDPPRECLRLPYPSKCPSDRLGDYNGRLRRFYGVVQTHNNALVSLR